MGVMMVTSRVKKDKVTELEGALGIVFSALDTEQPENVRYMSLKGSDGVTFVAVLEVEEGAENPLLLIPEFQEFQKRLPEWVDGPPATDQVAVVGSYGFFDRALQQDR
jgi:hypothetical protein